MVDMELKTKAFKVARDNMENLLGQSQVNEMVEFGSLEENPDIEWELTVETFDQPVDPNQMWVRAISIASFTGSSGEREQIKLVHWLTNLTEAQKKLVEDRRQRELQFMDEIIVNPYGEDPEGLLMFEESLAKKGKFTNAAKESVRLMRQYPDSFEAEQAADHARIYSRKFAQAGDYGIASDITLEIASAFPDSQRADQALSDTMKYAKEAAQKGYYKDAAKITKRIAEQNPNSKKAQTALGQLYTIAKMAAENGDYRSATEIADETAQSHPEIPQPEEITEARKENNWDDKADDQPPAPEKELPTLDEADPTNDQNIENDENNPDNDDFNDDNVEQKDPLTPQQYQKLIDDYKNGNVSTQQLNQMTRSGQITGDQMIDVIISPLSN